MAQVMSVSVSQSPHRETAVRSAFSKLTDSGNIQKLYTKDRNQRRGVILHPIKEAS